LKKAIAYVVAAIVSVFVMTPPVNINVTCQVNSMLWLWSVGLAGLLAFYYIHTDAPWPAKLLVLWAFVGSFLSAAPYWSFMMTIPTVAAAYFYLICRRVRVEDYIIIQKAVQSAFLLICAFMTVQLLGHDTLFNFNRPEPMVIGTIGNPMISATMITCLAPFLLTSSRWYIIPLCLIAFITYSTGMMAALAAGILFYGVARIKRARMKVMVVILVIEILFVAGIPQYAAKRFSAGRGPIWKRTAELTLKHPIKGWGISTFQLVFPAMSRDLVELGVYPKNEYWEIETMTGHQTPALQTHNCWLQFWFETGSMGAAMIIAFVVWLVLLYKVKNERTLRAVTGLVILGTLMLFHFPTRLWHAVPAFIAYLAFYELFMRKEIMTWLPPRKYL
jgi:O-antigen ligase